jgi:hypothetical protein
MIENTAVTQAGGDTFVDPKPDPIPIDLTTTELTRRCDPLTKTPYPKTKIADVLQRRGASLIVRAYLRVEESGRFWEIPRRPIIVERTAERPANIVAPFILGRIPDVDENTPCNP